MLTGFQISTHFPSPIKQHCFYRNAVTLLQTTITNDTKKALRVKSVKKILKIRWRNCNLMVGEVEPATSSILTTKLIFVKITLNLLNTYLLI